MQAEGRISRNIRFQCAIPGAHDVISITFPDVSTWPVLFKAWQEAVQEEYRRIFEVIPASEFCLQIDYCTEIILIGGTWAKQFDWVPDLPKEELFAYYTSPDYIIGHLEGLPEEVTIGFHVCCGTSPSYPVQELDDIGLPVDLSNAIQAATGGNVDYFHLPAMVDSDESYFAPLSRLNAGKAIMPDLLKTLAEGADHQAAAWPAMICLLSEPPWLRKEMATPSIGNLFKIWSNARMEARAPATTFRTGIVHENQGSNSTYWPQSDQRALPAGSGQGFPKTCLSEGLQTSIIAGRSTERSV
ncbi:MAG TPA: hypothetical protein VGC14_12460 [Rhizobium sp.]